MESDISAELKGVTFSASTKVTSTQLAGFIAQADAMIDGKVGQRYTTPITGANALLIVKRISILLVLAIVKPIFEVKTDDPKANQSPIGSDDYKKAMALLTDIVEGNLLLSDASALGTHGGIKSYNVDEEIDHTFEIGTDQW